MLEVISAFPISCGYPITCVSTTRRSGDVAISVADLTETQRQLGWPMWRTLHHICHD